MPSTAPSTASSTATRSASATWLPLAILLCGLSLTWAGYDAAQRGFNERMLEEFRGDVAEAQSGIDQRLRAYANYLYGLQALFVSSDTVTRKDFNRYVATVDVYRRYPGIQVTAFSRRVSAAEKAAFEAQVRSDASLRPQGYPDFRIKPPGQRVEYFVVEYVEPLAGNEALLGFDQYSEETRRRSVERLRDSGTLTASSPIVLVQDAARKMSTPGFQLRLPVYRSGAAVGTVAERQAAFTGSIGSAFRAADLVRGALAPPLQKRLRITLHDGGEAAAAMLPADDRTLLFDSLHAGMQADMPAPTMWRGRSFSQESTLAVGDRRWRLNYQWRRDLPPGHFLSQAILVSGVLISILGAALAMGYLRARQNVLALRQRSAALTASEGQLRHSETRFRDLTELSSDWYWETDVEHRFNYMSGRVSERSRVSQAEHLGLRRWEIPNTGVSEVAWAEHRHLLDTHQPFQEFVMGRPRPDTRPEYVSISGRPLFDPQGRFLGYRGVGSNITGQRQAQMHLQIENSVTRTLATAATLEEAIARILQTVCETLAWECAARWVLASANARFECQESWSASRAGTAFFENCRKTPRPAIHRGIIGGAWFGAAPVWDADLTADSGFQRAEHAAKAGLKCGFSVPIKVGERVISILEFFHTQPLVRDDFVVSVIENTGAQIAQFMQRKQTEETLLHTATHDALTGLPNRALLVQSVDQAVALARRSGGTVALLFVDLDRFKQINDTLGHAAGDTLLREAAARLAALVRDSDVVARQGGDEFVILAQEHGDRGNVAALAARVISTMSTPFVLEGADYIITASVGISVFPDDCTDGTTLLRNADAAMYRAKHAGRSNFQFYSEQLTADALDRLSLERGLRHAGERGELRLYYQPKRALATGRISGLEALLRWQHPERGLLLPDRFIPVAEESGLIVGIGAWVLDEACRQLRVWLDAGLAVPQVAVNISARQFGDGRLPGLVRVALDTHRLPGKLLELELTETLIMNEPERTIDALQHLRALGVSITVDDLGTGYSSLSYLHRFPISSVKIDRSFIARLPADADSAIIVSALISLGHNLGFKVVAEGVETPEQLAQLAAWQCDEIQGYLLSQPLGAGDCTVWLGSRLDNQGT